MPFFMPIRNILSLLRVRQWLKNGFVLFPLVFSGQIFMRSSIERAWIGFASFCLLVSAFYIINDILDLKKDRLHPGKMKRPLAAGVIGLPFAWLAVALCLFSGFFIAVGLDGDFLPVAFFYCLLQVSYNFGVKKIVLWDVIFVAFGFLLRVWAGAEAINVSISFWLLICVFVLALFLAFVKRRNEMSSLGEAAVQHREVLRHYSIYLLDQFILLTAVCAIVFYSLYTISPDVLARVGGYRMVPSVVFVIYGIMRYFYLAHVKKFGGDPTELLLQDRPLLCAVVCWGVYICYALYFI